jgi:hypothetical protein
MSFSELLFHSLSWLSRFVASRERLVIVADEVLDTEMWRKNQQLIMILLRRFQNGESVKEFLSYPLNETIS